MQRDAMNQCIRNIVLERLQAMGLKTTRMPLGSTSASPSTPILTSQNLEKCKRAIVYVGESNQELGILAGRLIDHKNIGTGSIINFVKGIRASDPNNETGIVVANPGQLLWYRRGRKALSFESWHTIPRPSAVSPGLFITAKNHIPRNYNPQEHVACVFEDALAPLIERGCKIAVIAAGNSGIDVVDFVQKDWAKWKKGVEAVVVTSGHVWQTEFRDEEFKDFWGKRGRAYMLSHEPMETPLTGRPHFGCNLYSSGEGTYIESIMPRAHAAIVDYFKLVFRHPDFENVPPDLDESVKEKPTEESEWGDDDGSSSVKAENGQVEELQDDAALSRAMDAVKISMDKAKQETMNEDEDGGVKIDHKSDT